MCLEDSPALASAAAREILCVGVTRRDASTSVLRELDANVSW